ncbi:C-GCAxxG-C-C family protein [Sunxiuqinia sp. sy24]|uniref:C-GCAxxG-C-C family protein n=1 Tax=Sunxiuqinia sp. sy24 TaxID=3461495 RepID=UPI0040454744
MKKSSIALQKFSSYNCSQSVFSSFADELGLDQTTALKLASGFGGGMACAETCGAVTGSYLVIGLKHGHCNADLLEKHHTKELILKFNAKFKAKHGSLICKELIGCDISTPDGQVKAKEKDAFKEFCPQFIATACDILEEDF